MNEIIVLKNVRRLMSKAWNKRTANWILIKEVFGCGAARAYAKCQELNIDADGFDL